MSMYKRQLRVTLRKMSFNTVLYEYWISNIYVVIRCKYLFRVYHHISDVIPGKYHRIWHKHIRCHILQNIRDMLQLSDIEYFCIIYGTDIF